MPLEQECDDQQRDTKSTACRIVIELEADLASTENGKITV